MINKYIISNGAAELFVTQRNGKTHSVFVDEENIKKLKELDVLWHVQWNEKANKYYAHATIYLGNSKYKNRNLYHKNQSKDFHHSRLELWHSH